MEDKHMQEVIYRDPNNVIEKYPSCWWWDQKKHCVLTPLEEEEVQELLDLQKEYGVARGFSYWRDRINKRFLADA